MERMAKRKPPFQVFDAHRPEEFAALERDIQEWGCLIPVEVNEDGHVAYEHAELLAASSAISNGEPKERIKIRLTNG